MQTFKHYLQEAVSSFAPWQDPEMTVDEALKYCYFDYKYGGNNNLTISKNKNGSFSSRSDRLKIKLKKLDDGNSVIPIKFQSVKNFKVDFGWNGGNDDLTTLEGCPTDIKEEVKIYSTKLTSLDHFQYKSLVSLELRTPNLTTFGDAKCSVYKLHIRAMGSVSVKEIENHFTIKGGLILDSACLYKKQVLSLLKFKVPQIKIFNYNSNNENYSDVDKVGEILNKYLSGDRNILNCQEELIDNGLEDYAQL